jgi:hypothetical protein
VIEMAQNDQQVARVNRALVEDHQAVRYDGPSDSQIRPSHPPDNAPNTTPRPDWAHNR